MTKAKTTKHALLMSVLSMMLCCAMLVSSTFAWFTDSVTSGNNRIVAGNLDVEVTHTNKAVTDQPLQDADALFPVTLWEPGVVSYETFTVINNGTLAFDYEFNFTAKGFNTVDGHSLKEVIQIGVIEGTAEGKTRQQLVDAVKAVKAVEETEGSVERGFAPFADFKYTDYILAEDKSGTPSGKTFTVVAYWEPSVLNDDDYNVNNGKKVEPEESDEEGNVIDYLYIDITVDVQAFQRAHESDSFDNQYDSDDKKFPDPDIVAAEQGFAYRDANGEYGKIETQTNFIQLFNNQSVTLIQDFEQSYPTTRPDVNLANTNTTIDLNGHTYKGNMETRFNEPNPHVNSVLTVKNGT